MLDINFITNNNSDSDCAWLCELLPILGSLLGTYLAYYLGREQALKNERLSDKRFFDFVVQMIEDCERIGIQLVNNIKFLESEFDLSDNNSRKVPDLTLIVKFEQLDHARIFDVLKRHKEFIKKNLADDVASTDIFDLIKNIIYIKTGSDDMEKLINLNNVNIIELRNSLSINVDELFSEIAEFPNISKQASIAQNKILELDESSNNSKLFKPKQFYDTIIPAIISALEKENTRSDKIIKIEERIRKCKVLYENIVQSNELTLNSKDGGIIKRRQSIESSLHKISAFIDTFLTRSRLPLVKENEVS